jgi:DHA1 family tetracycline resistance protein-like MFS transporter
VRPVVNRLGESKTVVVGLAFGALGFAVYALTDNSYIFMAAAPLISLWAMANPAFQGIATRFADASEQGRLQGALSSLRGVSGMIGPLFFTQILSASIATQNFPGASYFVAAALLLTSLCVAVIVTRGGVAAKSPTRQTQAH